MKQHEILDEIIHARRAVYPQMYNDTEISDKEIWSLLENANWAPTHKHTEPWRFIVFRGEALMSLGEWLAQAYKAASAPDHFSDVKNEKFRSRPMRSACVLGICMQRDPAQRLPEWEEIAAVACAVQNIWLSCAARGIGCYWSTPGFVINAQDFPWLGEGQRCLGLFYIGRWDPQPLPAVRHPVADKVIWIDRKF